LGRCQRMNKECHPSPPMHRQRTLKRRSHHETSKLEAKLDDIVTLLKSSTQGVPAMKNSQVSSILQATGSGGIEEQIDSISSLTGTGATNTLEASSSSNRAPPDSLGSQPILTLALEPSKEDAELILRRFRCDFVKTLPFINIPSSVTAHQLRLERPLLWIAIMTVASNSTKQQISLSKEARGIFAKEAFVEGTRNMDLLLAILVYTIWYVASSDIDQYPV
jgi:hypothetical protein